MTDLNPTAFYTKDRPSLREPSPKDAINCNEHAVSATVKECQRQMTSNTMRSDISAPSFPHKHEFYANGLGIVHDSRSAALSQPLVFSERLIKEGSLCSNLAIRRKPFSQDNAAIDAEKPFSHQTSGAQRPAQDRSNHNQASSSMLSPTTLDRATEKYEVPKGTSVSSPYEQVSLDIGNTARQIIPNNTTEFVFGQDRNKSLSSSSKKSEIKENRHSKIRFPWKIKQDVRKYMRQLNDWHPLGRRRPSAQMANKTDPSTFKITHWNSEPSRSPVYVAHQGGDLVAVAVSPITLSEHSSLNAYVSPHDTSLFSQAGDFDQHISEAVCERSNSSEPILCGTSPSQPASYAGFEAEADHNSSSSSCQTFRDYTEQDLNSTRATTPAFATPIRPPYLRSRCSSCDSDVSYFRFRRISLTAEEYRQFIEAELEKKKQESLAEKKRQESLVEKQKQKSLAPRLPFFSRKSRRSTTKSSPAPPIVAADSIPRQQHAASSRFPVPSLLNSACDTEPVVAQQMLKSSSLTLKSKKEPLSRDSSPDVSCSSLTSHVMSRKTAPNLVARKSYDAGFTRKAAVTDADGQEKCSQLKETNLDEKNNMELRGGAADEAYLLEDGRRAYMRKQDGSHCLLRSKSMRNEARHFLVQYLSCSTREKRGRYRSRNFHQGHYTRLRGGLGSKTADNMYIPGQWPDSDTSSDSENETGDQRESPISPGATRRRRTSQAAFEGRSGTLTRPNRTPTFPIPRAGPSNRVSVDSAPSLLSLPPPAVSRRLASGRDRHYGSNLPSIDEIPPAPTPPSYTSALRNATQVHTATGSVLTVQNLDLDGMTFDDVLEENSASSLPSPRSSIYAGECPHSSSPPRLEDSSPSDSSSETVTQETFLAQLSSAGPSTSSVAETSSGAAVVDQDVQVQYSTFWHPNTSMVNLPQMTNGQYTAHSTVTIPLGLDGTQETENLATEELKPDERKPRSRQSALSIFQPMNTVRDRISQKLEKNFRKKDKVSGKKSQI